jgi:tetratricopeptide (TPR) repeat protein
MKAELKGLSAEMAEVVGAHLMAAMQWVDVDPELAWRHAEAARRRAARLPIVREACAETAYAAGKFEEALEQYRAWHRMSGSGEIIPVMVDCLRALGRYRDALKLVEEGASQITDPAMRVELVIVTAGVRADMGQRDEALRGLRAEVEHPGGRQPRPARARLLYAFADLLDQAGDTANARRGFAMAASLDIEGATAAQDRLDALDGLVLDLDEAEFAEEDHDDEAQDDEAADQPDLAEETDRTPGDEAGLEGT